MKLDRKVLLQVLETIDPAVSNSGAIAVLKHVWFDGKYAYAYNGGTGIRVAWKSELNGGVLAAPLLGIIKGASATEVDVVQDEAQWTIKVGRAKITIPVLLADQNPWNFPDKLPETSIKLVTTEALLAGLTCVRQVKATKPNRVEHYGVVLFPSGADVALYTTDSKAMAEVFVEGPLPKELTKTVMPHEFVAELLKLGVGTKISFMSDAICAEQGDVRVCSNLLDSSGVLELPKFVDKTVGECEVVPIADGFAEALSRADALSGSDEAYLNVALTKLELQLQGRFVYGELQEKLLLVKGAKPTESTICVGLDQLLVLVKGAKDMAITEKALVLFGERDTTFLIAAHEAA